MTAATKNASLRHNEYYGMQERLDELYQQSLTGKKFTQLYEEIVAEKNILLAYRNIKGNTGSKTKGTDNLSISNIARMTNEQVIAMVRNRLARYKPHAVRRVEIPKPNGKLRPLGIPTISDRLIQQCILQILDPICEAKFHNHSYGFRPNRNTEHAIAMMYKMINQWGLHYVVDIDIKGFFDNVNHGKLLKQMWTTGIRDKRLLCIISAMLKAEIQGIGVPDKGTPQGGILSSLLSNIVLNELDWWISDQWESFKTRHQYSSNRNKVRAIKSLSNLKECYIIRYADDFKIMCRTRNVAERVFIAVKRWLKERLHLEISKDKSQITNLRKKHSEFLGIAIKAAVKGKKRIASSQIKPEAIAKIRSNGKKLIKNIQKNPTPANIARYNAYVLGVQNYYRIATNSNLAFGDIGYYLLLRIKTRWRSIATNKGFPDRLYTERYKGYNRKKIFVHGQIIYPMACCKNKKPMCYSKAVNKYTAEGREHFHRRIDKITMDEFFYMVSNPVAKRSVEYNDNRISLFSAQRGKCRVLKIRLTVHEFHCHHIKPISKDGVDKYHNLVILHPDVHRLVHATQRKTIEQLLEKLTLSKEQIEQVNEFRFKVGNSVM